MKRLKFQYEMCLELFEPVTDHHYRILCVPYEDRVQTAVNVRYEIDPAGNSYQVTDGFGNRACVGDVKDAHDHFRVRSGGVVEVDLSRRLLKECQPVFKYPSRYTSPEGALEAFYLEKVKPYIQDSGGRAVLDVSLTERLMDAVCAHMSYQPGVTDIHTTASEALSDGRGVCQDYAHILIGLCRMAGIPARYVAGMMMGEGFTHAWVEAYLGGMWIGIDPTNHRWVDEGYIKLTHGRDFADCTVDKGCFLGPCCTQRQTIYVKVEEEL